MSSIEIDSTGVIQLILQYLKENNLTESYQMLSKEAKVTTNIVSNQDLLISSIVSGKWDYVLEQISMLTLPKEVLMDLYEEIFYELIEIREMYTANEMIHKCEPLMMMKKEREERYLQMEYWLKKSYFDAVEAYPAGETKETRRQKLASTINSYLSVAPPSRLLTLLQQALAYEKEKGILLEGERLDIFHNALETATLEDAIPTVKGSCIQFPQNTYPETVCVSPNGQFVVTGSLDGLIEVWDLEKGALKLDLLYQKEERFMAHARSVLSLCFSHDSEYLASGDYEGTIKVWRVATGGLLRKFVNVHEKGVTRLCFSNNNQQICSASYDGTIRIHGLKSGKTLKVLRGHESYVNDICYSVDQQHIISASSDGTIRVWDIATTNCLRVVEPARVAQSYADISIVQILPMVQNPEYFFVIPRLHKAFVMSIRGELLYTFETDRDEIQFVAGCMSVHGKYMYCVSDDGVRYCYAAENGELVEKKKLVDHELLGMVHFPTVNEMITYSQKGELCQWRT